MKRLSITLTDSQAAALEKIAAETGATKQSMIGLAISDWVRVHDYPEDEDEAEGWEGWYGWAEVTEPDPLSGTPYTYSVGHDGPYGSREDAAAYAAKVAAGAAEDGVSVSAHVERLIRHLEQ